MTLNTELKTWMKDTAERTIFTFLQAFLGLLAVDASNTVDGLSVNTLEVAAISALISALAVVKGALARKRDGLSPASFISDAH